MGSEGVAGASETGLPWAKNKILMAMARPACRATTTTRRMRDGFASMAETTGYLQEICVSGVISQVCHEIEDFTYKFLKRNTADIASPTPTKA